MCRDGSGYITNNPGGGRTEGIRINIGAIKRAWQKNVAKTCVE